MQQLFLALIPFSPALLAAAVLFPFYWIGQYRLLRRTGSWLLHAEAHRRAMGFLGKAVLVSYALVGGAFFVPEVFPVARRLLKEGWLFWGILAPFALDLVILVSFSHDKAAELWKAEQPPPA